MSEGKKKTNLDQSKDLIGTQFSKKFGQCSLIFIHMGVQFYIFCLKIIQMVSILKISDNLHEFRNFAAWVNLPTCG